MSRRRRLEEATKREGELEREVEKLKRRVARYRKRVEDLGGEAPEESPSATAAAPAPVSAKEPVANACEKCGNPATLKKFGPREYWTCPPCKWVKPVGKKNRE